MYKYVYIMNHAKFIALVFNPESLSPSVKIGYCFLILLQVVKLREVFPHGSSLVLEFEYMLSDLSEVIRNTDKPLSEGQVKSYMLMLLKGVAFCHENNIMHRVGIIRQMGQIRAKVIR